MSFRLLALIAGLLWLGVLGCTEAPVTVPLRSLERSGDVAFVCRGADGTGRDINSCPDFENQESPHHLLALVTQTIRGEVAVVDLSAGGVLDLDHATPGFDFLPIGAQPRDIVATPDGAVTFVGSAEVGREGIFVIPTTCVEAPPPDITTWPSCALPFAPGEMVIVDDPLPRFSCDGSPDPEPPTGLDCPGVNLTERRKLIVALPEDGSFAIMDTHDLAALPQGGFPECPARYVKLDVNLPAGDVPQDIPPDLEAPGCVPPELNHGPIPTQFLAQPAGFALADSTLFIADRAAPVVHSVDVSNPCEPKQLPPLLPKSFEAPGRTVTTSRVAVSPPTSKGQRFVYAIDELEGSVMVFEITPGSSQRTPLVRPGTRRLPFEPADRIAFTAPAQDLTFALRDVPIVDPNTGVTTIGTYCDPIGGSLGAQYRTSQDYTRGAAPRELRGVFGFVALSSGQVMVIDVEDFDAPCRRPTSSNSAAEEDFRGCENDPTSPETYIDEESGQRTVSGEASCEIVQPHRARSGSFVVTSQDLGVHAPSLRNFPQLQAPAGGTLPTGPDEEGRLSPKLLAVDFVNPEGGTTPAQVHVGTSLYEASEGAENELVLDPAIAERPSVALLFNQPRAFAPEEEYTLTYEGAFVGERPGGNFDFGITEPSVVVDPDSAFCNRGVQDAAATREVGPELGVEPADLDAFARRHADYVQITSELTDGDDDGFWNARSCGGEPAGKASFFECRNQFGTKETPNELRDLRILEAYQGRLVIEPRAYGSEAEKNEILELLHCCFGDKALQYKVRAGHQWALVGAGGIGFRNDVVADPTQDFRCIRDCNPRRSLLRSRAFEISSTTCQAPGENDPPPDCAIGYATSADVACVIDSQSRVTPTGAGSECIFENLTHRFAIYRGNEPTLRDTAFAWQIAGGFITLGANLAAQTAAVSPQSLVFVPQIGQLAVVDGAAEGLVLVSLDSVAVSRLFF